MIDTARLIDEKNIVDVISHFIPLKRKGREHVGVCPFHGDSDPSLMVNEKKRIFKCFSCSASGDVIQFVMKFKDIPFLEACKLISGTDYEVHDDSEFIGGKKIITDNTVYARASFYPQNIFHHDHGVPDGIWFYHDKDGFVIGAVCRFNLNNGAKEVIPLSYVIENEVSCWRWKGFKVPRPLYNLHLIHRNPNAVIVMVEGEKTADAGQQHFDDCELIFSTWSGGANGLVNADFSPLHGRKVILLPDHDTDQAYDSGEIKPWYEQPGNKAMIQIHELTRDKVPFCRWIAVPNSYPHKWDIADNEWGDHEIRLFFRNNLVHVPSYLPKHEKKC